MNYPLTMTFKVLALAPQIFVRDANGTEIMYVKQKLFKLKEAINIFSDQSQSRQIYAIKADRIIDFSARYNFSDSQGMSLGAVKRRGMRSLWKASYDIFDGEQVVFQIQEENAMIKVIDALFGEIPVIGMFSGYVFNPAYLVTRPGSAGQPGPTVMRLSKQPAFLETGFKVEKVDQTLSAKEEEQILLSLLMMTLLERSRG
ncbi:MAG: hypothetical protein DPW09_28490 [Anaerolineae bacterium]|nr:hypothetical protein [Anaerolineales bacterium]MCQ3977386.1 hypothetical protein [Anaerolineae bacterium]